MPRIYKPKPGAGPYKKASDDILKQAVEEVR